MKLRNYLHLLMFVVISCASGFAQTPPDFFDSVDQLSKISLDEAEKHLIERKPPKYPPIAKLAKVEGDVRLTLQIDSNGAVVRVLESSGHPLLLQAAIDAAKQYRYQPFMANGTPAEVLAEAAVSFSLFVPLPPSVPFPEITDMNSVVIEYDDGFFAVSVSGSGLVEYDGKYRVVVEGKHERRIDSTEVQQLVDALRGADFFSLRDDYIAGATDVGRTTVSIQIGTLRKAIIDDWVQVPPHLKDVHNAILKYSHSDQWVKGNRDTVPGLLAETSDLVSRAKILSEILPRAALYGDTAVVRDILANAVDLEHKGPYNATPLLLAADRGLPDMVAALLNAGAKPHTKDGDGRGALIFGSGSGNSEVVQLLLFAGLNGNEKDKYGDTALMAAAASGNPECVRLLLKSGARVNARNKRRQTALHSGASGDSGFYANDFERGHAEVPEEMIHRDVVVKMLLDAGADMNARDWDGETALFSLEDDVVQELINRHINLEARDNYGQTALIETVSGSITELLVKAGANVNAQDNDGKTALIMAAENNEIEKLRVLVKAPGIDFAHRDKKGETAFMKARAKHLEDGVRILLSAGTTI